MVVLLQRAKVIPSVCRTKFLGHGLTPSFFGYFPCFWKINTLLFIGKYVNLFILVNNAAYPDWSRVV